MVKLIPEKLNEFDLHFIFDGNNKKLKCFLPTGKMKYFFEARNDTVAPNAGYFHHGYCPPGEYLFGAPILVNEIAFGKWFIPMLDPKGYWIPYGRGEIGAHGGGSGAVNPFAPRQGWFVTHGCWRLQNINMERLVESVNFSISNKGNPYVSVVW